MTAFVCAMPMELRPLRRRLRLRRDGSLGYRGRVGDRDVVAVVTGMGTARAGAATARLLDSVDVERAVVVGITGAIENETPIGTVVVPESVINAADGAEYTPTPLSPGARGIIWTTDELIVDPVVHAELRARGVVSLDMETAAVARVCEHRGVPWSVVRAVSDRASDGSVDAAILGLSRQDGTADLPAVARHLLRHPGSLPRLVRLGRGSRLATERAAEAAVRAVF